MSNIFYKDFDINLSRIKRRTKNNFIKINLETENNKKLSLKHYYKINTNKEIKLPNNSNKTSNNNNNYISSSDLYTMPNYKTKPSNFFTKINNELILIKNKKKQIRNALYKLNNIHTIKKRGKTIDQFANLPNFMKNRFYSDVEDKLNYQFKYRPFYYDTSVKNKIIQLNQIKEFWGGMSDYTNPILCTKRVRYLSKLIEDKKNIRENKDNEILYHKLMKKRNRIKIMPKLYTNNNFIEKRKEDKEIKIFSKEKKNKTEDNMQYII